MVALGLVTGCARSLGRATSDAGTGGPGAPVPTAGVGLSSSALPAQAPRTVAPCTATTVFGDVHASTENQPLAVVSGDPIPWPAWIDIGTHGRLQVEVLRSDRELVFLGPAIVEPCTRGEERASLLIGRFESALALMHGPRAEEWIVTPFSVVRYESAALTIDVETSQTTAELTQGQAAAFGDTDAAFAPLLPGVRLRWTGAPVDLAGAATAVTRCESDVAAARTLDAKPGSVTSDERARAAHGAARACCAIAELRVAALTAPSEARASLVLRMNALAEL